MVCVCVCVCVRERERERESVCACVCVRTCVFYGNDNWNDYNDVFEHLVCLNT